MISFDECLVASFLAQEGSNLLVKLEASPARQLLILSKVSPLIVSDQDLHYYQSGSRGALLD